jgi:small subunit ribosomal protein S16
MITIRMSRGGRKNAPVYTIVAQDSRKATDGTTLERLGQYNPCSADAEIMKQIKVESIAKWVKNGAIMSDTVKSLLKKHKIQINL